MCMMVKQLTGAVGGGGNPFAPSPGGGAMVVQTGYKASFLGQDIVFADEAQYLKVKYAYEQKIGKGGGGFSSSDSNEDGGEGLLGTMGKALSTVGAFLAGRNLQTKIDDLEEALAAQTAARSELAALPPGATMGDLMPKLLKYLDAERDATELAQAALEDQVLAEDLRVGGGVAQLIQSFTKGGGGSLGGGSFGTAAAVGIGGLGLATMFSRKSDRRSSRR